MLQGGKFLLAVSVLACTACLADQGKLEIRSVERGLKSGREPVPYRIAEARGHLALGNVALALEGFRKAARDDPSSIVALAGIAECYQRLNRFDLSQRYYEMALAVAPRDQGLLAAFAASLEAQGRGDEALAVRRELAALAASPVHEMSASVSDEGTTPANASAVTGATAQAERPQLVTPAPVGQSVTIALPPARPVGKLAEPDRAPQAMAVAPVGRSVTIALPPPRPAPASASRRGPRVERLSLTEVALISGNGPSWKPVHDLTTGSAARSAQSRAGELRLLNAARIEKLAARTRNYLGRFGWRDVTIGDAASARARSLIVYPRARQAEARKLSARLGFAMAQRADVRQLTILLGRDAVTHPGLRSKG